MELGSLTLKELGKVPGVDSIIYQAAALCELKENDGRYVQQVYEATAEALVEIERARANAVSRNTITVEVTPQVMSLMRQLHRTGLYGLTISEIAERFISDKLISLLPVSVLKLSLKRSRSSVDKS
jgi:hypothetical protein